MAEGRSKRLNLLFILVLKGKKTAALNNPKLFLEAICEQPSPVSCISNIVASAHGPPALLLALSADTSLSFLNGLLTNFLEYIKAPELQTVCGGSIIREILTKLVEAPLTWESFIKAVRDQALEERALSAFAWVLLQLLSLPVDKAVAYLPVANDESVQKALMSSSDAVRFQAKRILNIAKNLPNGRRNHTLQGPGGRHDNDFAEISRISIYPTHDELQIAPSDVYLPRVGDTPERAQDPDGLACHIDGQFRLLRENMLCDLREELKAAAQPKKWRRRPLEIKNLTLESVHCDERLPWSLQLVCQDDLPQFRGKDAKERKKLLKDNPKFLKHGFLACLYVENRFITLGNLVREEDLLAQSPSKLCIQIPDKNVEKVLMQLKNAGSDIRLLHLDTAIFSYEPILKQLTETRELLLAPEIVAWQAKTRIPPPDYFLSNTMLELLEALQFDNSPDLQSYLQLPKPIKLDKAQTECFCAAFNQRVVMMQGPPGTGKSFIGSLIGKAIYQGTHEKILVVCFTHHALDDFVEHLLKLGIPDHDIVRLGSVHKATANTKALSLNDQKQTVRFTREQWNLWHLKKVEVAARANNLKNSFNQYFHFHPGIHDLLEFLEFCEDDLPFFSAFQLPEDEGGMTYVGKKGKGVDKSYLLSRWLSGADAGIFKLQVQRNHRAVWRLTREERDKKQEEWYNEMTKDRLGQVCEASKNYNQSVKEVDEVFLEKDLAVMRSKRIIACTTTAAAKYSKAIQCISPGALLVEEAGEILESHVLTALGPETKHLILIGDHKQLRPKVNYELSVEKKTGYDLNRSLFERLILKGFPYQTLFAQHRMRPEISALVRQMTYPELKDAKETEGRPNLRGFTDNIIFVNHTELESEFSGTRELGDTKASSSKQNHYEADMTLKCVRYLAQQGYGTDDIVVLTPYLGQLRLLHDKLKIDNDPVLNDLDSYDLVRAGLMPEATANVNKPRLRISTIDNFQGEEATIVIASLTRSNVDCGIGFMSAPERLNVLISRARDAMILIGNAEHFMGSRKGGELWTRFIGLLKAGMHVYDGFPVRCERHPDRTALLEKPIDFEMECPDGGCKEPCEKMLNCGIHKCPDRCHQLHDHSKIKCKAIISSKCAKGHVNRRKCHAKNPDVCQKCEIEAKKAREEDERKAKALEDEQQHLLRIAELDREIAAIKAEAARKKAAEQQALALKQKEKDLETAKENARKKLASVTTPDSPAGGENANGPTPNQTPNPVSQPQTEPDPEPLSPAEADWERQKQFEGASNDAIDDLMKLTGLEDVKEKVLNIKSKIDIVAQQGTDVSKERFSVTMLGNPGTGKTTVARIYGRFLASVNVIPGSTFVEVTGSSLANDGVSGAKKMIEGLAGTGGGVFFLDEAYQLASGNSHGGKAVLDYLLAEIEERRGTIVFILAGYKKEMEAFFEHNPGFTSRVPHTLDFADYSDKELLKMLGSMLQKKYNGRAKLEDGLTGLYARILIRRQGRRRGSRAYGNARDLENTWACVTERQASRLRRDRSAGLLPDLLFFSKTDLIGPEPSEEYLSQNSQAWQELQKLIGLKSVKQAVATFLKRICLNYQRELAEEPPLAVSLNRLFLGSPGTGKTTVAKLYGAILAELGLLSKGEVVNKTPPDFIGAVLGESEKNTKAILQASVGKVLLIDEAYGLSPVTGSIGSHGGKEPYKTAVIDTIVAEVQSVPGEDRCVLLLGYTEPIKEMLKNANPGLSRRFPLDSAFHFEDYDDEALRKILELKLKAQGLEATEEAKDVAIGLLARARDRPNFGNAGEVENLLSRAKDNWQKRQTPTANEAISHQVIFGPEDFDEKFDRTQKSESTVTELFSDIVGLDQLIKKLEGFQKLAVNLKARGMDPRENIPFNFVFKGPPGTGKTTVARRIAQFYYNIGILPTNEYTDCSAADLVGAYVGQTAPKTKEILRSALGKVLFIDEAYRLRDSKFGEEAINEIVDCLTKPDFKDKLVVILAGYTEDMNELLKVNRGLSSRFPEDVFFESMQPKQCIELLASLLLKSDIEVTSDIHLPKSSGYQQIFERFSKLRELPSWGSGRDVHTLKKKIVSAACINADQSAAPIKVLTADILKALDVMFAEQTARSSNPKRGGALNKISMQAAQQPPSTNMPNISTSSSCVQKACPPPVIKTPPAKQALDSVGSKTSDCRDSDVSDEDWEQLQRDVAALNEQRERAAAELRQQEDELEQAQREFENAQKQILILQQLQAEERARAKAEEESRRQKELEQARIQAIEHKLAQDAEEHGLNALQEAQLRKQRQEEESRRQRELEQARIRAIELKRARDAEQHRLNALREAQLREEKVQKKLQNIGVCVQGFRWIKQSGGYRCAGGSHFVSDAQLGL